MDYDTEALNLRARKEPILPERIISRRAGDGEGFQAIMFMQLWDIITTRFNMLDKIPEMILIWFVETMTPFDWDTYLMWILCLPQATLRSPRRGDEQRRNMAKRFA